MKSWLVAALVVLSLGTPADAASLKLGKPGYGGPGCPGGTASVALSSDGTKLSVRFSQYKVEAGGARSFDRMACGLSIPVTVPAGRSFAVIGVDFTGYTSLPAGAKATFRLEEFFAGGRGPVFSRDISGPKNGKFTASAVTAGTAWSACGAAAVMRTNTSLIINTTGGKPASASIRNQDVQTAIVYRLKWRDC